MACEYCDGTRDLFGGAQDEGLNVESLWIEYLYDSSGEKPKTYPRILAEMAYGEAWTKPINYCPMCGEKLITDDN